MELATDGALEGVLERVLEGDPPRSGTSDLISRSSSMGIAEENTDGAAGEGAREGFRFSTRGSINEELDAYAVWVSGPSKIVSAREYVRDNGRVNSRATDDCCRSEYDR